jgi:phosphoribosylformimino-5-aminoimidazole carboxamide ribotide isomerase
MAFTIIPAIDLKDGRCVRLRQGRAEESTVYSDDPVQMARRWESEGAAWLHVVDLDGAFHGNVVHADVIRAIVAAISIPVEVGGGLRTDADVRRILDCGVQRAIIGTRAFSEPGALAELVRQFGGQLAVGIDARDGMVQVRGWVETTAMPASKLAAAADAAGIQTLIYTDTATDGMMAGPNTAAVDRICAGVRCGVIASGGVTRADDVRALCSLQRRNLVGAVVGKALYEGGVTLSGLQAAVPRQEGSAA